MERSRLVMAIAGFGTFFIGLFISALMIYLVGQP